MADQTCSCCEQPTEHSADRTAAHDRWLGESAAMEAPLPPDVAERSSRLFGVGSIETFGEFVTAIRDVAGDDPLALGDLCHATGRTPHRATMGDETYFFQCFLDGVVLAHAANESVAVRTESPTGEPIEMGASPDGDIECTPSGAVMSFGVANVTPPSDGDPTSEDEYEAICPYVKAFRSREAYERWAGRVGGATVAMPLAVGVSVAAALTK